MTRYTFGMFLEVRFWKSTQEPKPWKFSNKMVTVLFSMESDGLFQVPVLRDTHKHHKLHIELYLSAQLDSSVSSVRYRLTLRATFLKETTWMVAMWQWYVCHHDMTLGSVDRLQYFTGVGMTNQNLSTGFTINNLCVPRTILIPDLSTTSPSTTPCVF